MSALHSGALVKNTRLAQKYLEMLGLKTVWQWQLITSLSLMLYWHRYNVCSMTADMSVGGLRCFKGNIILLDRGGTQVPAVIPEILLFQTSKSPRKYSECLIVHTLRSIIALVTQTLLSFFMEIHCLVEERAHVHLPLQNLPWLALIQISTWEVFGVDMFNFPAHCPLVNFSILF